MFINARKKQFNAVAVVNPEMRSRVKIRGSGVTSVVDENGNHLKVYGSSCK